MALAFLCKVLASSQRNARHFANIRGYEILAALLRQRNHLFTEQTLDKLFRLGLGISARRREVSQLAGPFCTGPTWKC